MQDVSDDFSFFDVLDAMFDKDEFLLFFTTLTRDTFCRSASEISFERRDRVPSPQKNSLSFSLSLSLSLPSLSLSRSLSFSVCLSLSLSLSPSLYISLFLSLSFSISISLSFSLSLYLFFSLSLSHSVFQHPCTHENNVLHHHILERERERASKCEFHSPPAPTPQKDANEVL